MPANEIHLEDIGTVFVGTVKDDAGNVVDISGATTKQFTFKKPDGSKAIKTAIPTTDGTDGKMQYVAVSGDLDQAGGWRLQGKVILPSGTWYTDVHRFDVHTNL